MCKQSKLGRKLTKARAMKMTSGPSKTTKSHTKVNTWYNPNSKTFWKKPKDTKKSQGGAADERAGLEFFRALAEAQAKMQRKLRAGMDA
jgi:hypothetical protein